MSDHRSRQYQDQPSDLLLTFFSILPSFCPFVLLPLILTLTLMFCDADTDTDTGTDIDRHESLMTGASSILELCSSSLRAFGFLECIPWFSAPELHLPYIALPKMEQFTGATYG